MGATHMLRGNATNVMDVTYLLGENVTEATPVGGKNVTDTSHMLGRGNMIDVSYLLGEKCDRCKLPTK